MNPIVSLNELPGVHDARIDGTRAKFSVDTEKLNHVLERLIEFDVRTLTSSPPTLEELFLRHYGEDLAPRDAGHEPAGAR